MPPTVGGRPNREEKNSWHCLTTDVGQERLGQFKGLLDEDKPGIESRPYDPQGVQTSWLDLIEASA